MMKVRILDRCEFCDGEAYIFVCEDVDVRGETFDKHVGAVSEIEHPGEYTSVPRRPGALRP